MSAYLSPLGGAGAQFFSNAGVVLSGGKLYTYAAGSTTPKSTWTTSLQSVTNANPIVLDSAGRPPNEIWLSSGLNNYKFILTDSSGNVLGTWDEVMGINTVSSVQSEWVTTGFVITYVGPTQFSVPGDQTSVFTVNRRIQYQLSSGLAYGYVSASAYAGNVTTVTVVADSTNLDATVSVVNYSFINATNLSVPQQYLRSGVAINSTPIGTTTPAAGVFTNLTSSNVTITGGTISGITGFSTPDFLLISQGVS